MITRIKAISVKEIDAHGNEYQDRQRNAQARVSIQIDNPAYEGKWLSMFSAPGDFVTKWIRGQEVDIQITENGDFINFKPSKPASKAMADSFRTKAGLSDVGQFPNLTGNRGDNMGLPANEEELMRRLKSIEEMVRAIHGQIINPL